VRGPVPVHSGGPGHATPQGTFTVSWKDRTHVSAALGGIPMPDAVFFAAGGIAFHEGPLTRASAGCVHLSPGDAAAFYDALHRGAQVQVFAPGGDPASGAPAPARHPAPIPPPAAAPVRRGAAAPRPGRPTQPGIPGVPAVAAAAPRA
jgi:hypothetical protein